MIDFCLLASLVLGILVPIWILMAALESRRNRLREQQRPLEDRITDIRKDASFMIGQLQGILDRFKDEQPRRLDWIPPTIEYYRRLDELASRSDATSEEVARFADEATTFVRKRRLKGICVGLLARRLAEIAHRRNAA